MDAIALLCTLHADGPATVRRLRRAGCSSLSELLAFDVERLASILGSPPAVARRFQREAKSLSERQGQIWHEREEAVPFVAAVTSEPSVRADEAGGAPDELPLLQGREQRILDEVLATWRRKDAQETSATEGQFGPTASPTAVSAAARSGLRPGLVDGLDAEACARLAAAGVADLDELARVDPVAVARAAGLGFTRVARWRALADRARRAGQAGGVVVVAARSLEQTLAYEPPRTTWLRVAGVGSERRFSPSESPPVDIARGLGLELVLSGETPVGAVQPTRETCAGPFA